MRITSFVALALMVAACRPSADDPVASARALVRLARSDRCADTWPFYTKASQQALERRTNETYGTVYAGVPADQRFNPYDWECSRFAGFMPRTIREVARKGDTAVIAVIWRTGTRFPIIPFLSSPLEDRPTEFQMTLEDGVWKVVGQTPAENPRRDLIHHGKWTIDWPRHEANDGAELSVNGLMDADPESVEAVFLDYVNWPRWMPYLVEARALSPVNSTRHQKVYVRYQLPGDTVGVDFVIDIRLLVLTRDHANGAFGAIWRIAKHDRTPPRQGVTRLSSWDGHLQLRVNESANGPAGLLIHYGWSGLPREWPPSLGQQLFSPEYAAQVMDGFEREARARTEQR